MDSEKFCLKWNDFETNISTAFRELREDKDFFNVTLACDDVQQIQAHKVILAACSPLFRTILKRHHHDHPLLYLKGVRYADLVAVINFMYQGEVNVAQEDLNTFLSVAEELKVKGLTQNKGTTNNDNLQTVSKPGNKTKIHETPPVKKFKPTTTIPHSKTQYDDDVQEVLHIKSEPVLLPNDCLDDPITDLMPSHSYAGAGTRMNTALVDNSDNSAIYGEYGEFCDYDETQDQEGYENSVETTQSTIGGNKDMTYLEDTIGGLMSHSKDENGGIVWNCGMCDMQMKKKHNMKRHVEAFHVSGFVHSCNICGSKHRTKAAVEGHKYQKHRDQYSLS